MRILFYTPLNNRCRDIESQANEFKKNDHSIFLLTQSPRSSLHKNFEMYGYKTQSGTSIGNPYLNLLSQVITFVWYCWRNKIDTVYAHLEPSNFVAILGQYFVKAKIIVCRHHMDYALLLGFDQSISYRLTYSMARTIIVVSSQTKEYMVQHERINEKKIHQINLAYDFKLYGTANIDRTSQIKSQFHSDILLLTICRLDKFKRPELSIQLVKELVNIGINVKLMILGEGAILAELQKLVGVLNIDDRVFFTGYVENVLDYMAAADFLIHPSISESSCISLKEAGIVSLPAIVCKGVGDFDEVIEHNRNGFLVDKNEFVKSSVLIVKNYLANKDAFKLIGKNLRATIFDKFDIKKTAPYYEKTFHQVS